MKSLKGTLILLSVHLFLIPLSARAQTYPTLPAIPEPPENPITEEKRILGKILFWDEQLSSDNTMACGTCHIISTGGTDPRPGVHPGADGIFGNADDIFGSKGVVAMDADLNPIEDPLFGFDVQVTGRATPTNIAAMFAPDHFWDGRARSQFNDPITGATIIASGGALESQAVGPILNTVEMAHIGRDWDDVRAKLESITPMAITNTNMPTDMQAVLTGNPSYPDLFETAFGDNQITPVRIALALATYQRTLLPNQTPWDRYNAGDSSALTAAQIRGLQRMETDRCMECHVPPMFTDHNFYNIGMRPSSEDLGRQSVTENTADRGAFKTPTLRNVGLRQHLGHVGWVTDTWDAIDFYNAENTTAGFDRTSRHFQFTADQSRTPVSDLRYSVVQVFPLNEEVQDDVANFLNNGLTDPRVANETFPFDRPTLRSEFSPDTRGDQLKMMTYNIDSTSWSENLADRVAAIIDVEMPHIIGLQEVSAVALASLNTRLSGDYHFVATTGANNHNPILVRRSAFDIIANGSTAEGELLNCSGNSYINYALLQTVGGSSRLLFHNTQLCDLNTDSADLEAGYTAEETNQAQAIALVNLMQQNISTYSVVAFAAGDFNLSSNSDTMTFLTEQVDLPGPVSNPLVLDDSYTTANSTNNIWHYGILYQPDDVTVISSQMVRNPSTARASGHSPMVSIVEIDFPISDQDGDGVSDDLDNCPTVSNADQTDRGGINSTVADGIGDACQCGDMNGDGRVTVTDSVLIQRHLLGLPSPFSEAHCDINGDSQCSRTDAVILRRAMLGLPPSVAQTCTAATTLQ